jgi:prepilin-type N-terminal cleavage/methylation domain-containing protein
MYYRIVKARRGFTLAELVIVLLVSGATMAIATPPIARAFRKTAAQSAADEFVTTHVLAKSAAIRYGRTAELHIDADNERIWVEVDTSSAGGIKDTIGIVKDMSRHKVDLSSNRTVLCFDGRGLPTTRGICDLADAQLTFTADADYKQLNITALGRILR